MIICLSILFILLNLVVFHVSLRGMRIVIDRHERALEVKCQGRIRSYALNFFWVDLLHLSLP